MKQVYELHAEICKTLANPKRIEIIDLLQKGERSVAWLIEKTGLLKANLSQHLTVMRSRGIVKGRREGVNVYYRIANPKVVKACKLMREVLLGQLAELKRISRGGKRLF